MDLQLRGKRALITGASRGIGLAVAVALAAEGADVALAARNADNLAGAAERVRGHGGRVLVAPADTADDESVRALVGRVVAEWGGIDVLVNAAAEPAAPANQRLAGVTDDEVRAQLETKVLGYLRTARAAAPHMVEQGWGRIINISGLAARQVNTVAGSIRNVAVASMTKTLADELGPQGVNVTVVHPGMTVTERLPGLLLDLSRTWEVDPEEAERRLAAPVSIGRLVTAEEVADVVAFLASPRSVAITGDAVAVGGGARGAIHY